MNQLISQLYNVEDFIWIKQLIRIDENVCFYLLIIYKRWKETVIFSWMWKLKKVKKIKSVIIKTIFILFKYYKSMRNFEPNERRRNNLFLSCDIIRMYSFCELKFVEKTKRK